MEDEEACIIIMAQLNIPGLVAMVVVVLIIIQAILIM